jgi:hypothetical protein
MNFKKGDIVVYCKPELDRTIYVIDSVVDGKIRFEKWEHHGHSYSPDKFIPLAILESPLWKALE